jgi:hypothetical protein
MEDSEVALNLERVGDENSLALHNTLCDHLMWAIDNEIFQW